ncbi:M20 metallopeptidase family protein [Virgibacillus sp. W0181]|uniref:M20 metallopeptidase family protein n=1 Tax=Virgibacillus sp. W0181 TaxID=3391581 RepID=UPI003F48AE86
MKTSEQLQQWMVEHRRHLHQYPELSHQEKETTAYIKNVMTELGYICDSLTGKDVIATFPTKKEGKTIAIRADMDALPIQEETNLPFASKVDGSMHACGHDGHMAMVLGVAKYFSEHEDKLKGNVKFIFQHAEEVSPGGAKELVKRGVLENVDAIVGAHLWQPVSSGKVAIRDDYMMAGVSEFDITIQGHGGHGSMPETTIDPILVGAQVITQFHTIVSRSLKPADAAVISFGELQSGTNYNIIPDKAHLSGTVRYFKESVCDQIEDRMNDILQGTCQAFGATYEMDFNRGEPPVTNDPKLAAVVRREAGEVVGADNVYTNELTLGGEDFAYYTKEIPAVYFFIGVGSEERVYGHHHPKFDIDEDMLITGCTVISNVAKKLLSEGAY